MSIYKSDSEPRSGGAIEQTYNICDEPLNQHLADRLPDDDPQDLDFTQVGSEFIIGNDPTLGTEESLNPLLLDFWILSTISFREPEGNDGKAWHVAL